MNNTKRGRGAWIRRLGCSCCGSAIVAVMLCAVLDGQAQTAGLSGEAGAAQEVTLITDATAQRRAQDLEKRLSGMETALAVIEARLGRVVRPPTLTYNLERRITDVEKRLDAIGRELMKLGNLERDMKRMEDRLCKVERTKQ